MRISTQLNIVILYRAKVMDMISKAGLYIPVIKIPLRQLKNYYFLNFVAKVLLFRPKFTNVYESMSSLLLVELYTWNNCCGWIFMENA